MMDKKYIEQRDIKKALELSGILLYGTVPFSAFDTLIECRAKYRLPVDAKSVIVVALPYYVGEFRDRNISRYAMVKDYHDVFLQILQSVVDNLKEKYTGEYACFTDISPIPEVKAAQLSGIGVKGDNNLIITKEYGSYVFIGEIVTDLYIKHSSNDLRSSGCLHCGLCKKNCPTQALSVNGFDGCLSHITQKKGELTLLEQELIRNNKLAWGCDTCQDVCPMNKGKEKTTQEQFLLDIVPIVTLDNVEKLMKSRAFGFRGKKVITRNILLLK